MDFHVHAAKKYFKTAKSLKEHLAKKQLKCMYIYDSVTDTASQTGSVKISSSLRMHDERDNRFTTMNTGERGASSATTTSIVPNISNELTTSNIPTSPFISSPTQFAEINISPLTTDDHTIFNDIDISAQFNSFKQDANNRIQQGTAITMEENMQDLLALSSILLLKPARTHKDLHNYIDLNTCDALCQHIIEEHKMTNQAFPSEIKLQLEEIMMQLDVDGGRGKACTRLAASQKIAALIQDNDLNPVNRVLLSVRNVVEKLPRRIIENGLEETELITRYLEAILSPLFEDLDNNIAFRWTSVSDDENQANIQPDASINTILGALLGNRIGCGEVKAQYQALNHRLVGIDLMRIATLAKDASDKHKLKSIFSFLVVGECFVKS